MNRQAWLLISSAVFVASVAIGCAPQASRTGAQSGQSTTQPDQTAANQTASSSSSASPTAQASTQPNRNASQSQDAPFMMEAAQGGMTEVQLGQLAQQQASSNRVKQFGQRMVQDHNQANAKLMQVFQQKGMTPPTTIGAKYSAMQEQLAKLSGQAFDRQYMSQMVEDHTEDVSSFQREVSTGKDAQVRAWASQTLPALKEHLQLAKTVNQSLTGSTKP